MNTNLLINNKSVTGDADPYQVINPFNSEIIAEVNQSSIEQVNLAVQAAKDAFPKWSRTSPGERSSMLLKLADAIDSKAEEIAKIESLNTGKPFHLALNDELPAISDVFRYYAGACRNMPGMAAGEYMSGFTSMVRRDPIGVVASIAPWNYPLMMGAWKIAPAIAAGNTMVLKPSEQTPLSTLFVSDLISNILPEGVVNIIHGIGETVGSTLINHPDVNMISLTGDIATGSRVLEAASKITNVGEVPYDNPTYAHINSVGRQWIFRYTLALAKELLAYIRGKYQVVPVPGSEASLNQADLLADARTEKENLLSQLRETLDESSRTKQLENKALETENLEKTLKAVPMTIYVG